MIPPLLKILSEVALLPGTQRYFLAILASNEIHNYVPSTTGGDCDLTQQLVDQGSYLFPYCTFE